ncbi:MAG: hypothetical protein QM727_07305 [Niabella sp.]
MKWCFYFFLLFNLTACQLTDKDCKKSEDFLKEFNKGISKELPPSNSNLLMLFKLDDRSIIRTNNIELYKVYQRAYEDKFKFSDYLCSLFNEQLYLKKTFFPQNNNGEKYEIVQPNRTVEGLSLNQLISMYCKKEDNHFKLSNNLNHDIELTVLYSFFRNKMYISFDDYEGCYIINDSL